ncbi:MAG: M28 family peptidase [Candidatus Kapabacteria bacterium]|nr:M28 family peptidase [Candidatus Kapabacteria bacterium]
MRMLLRILPVALIVTVSSMGTAFGQQPITPEGQRIYDHVRFLASETCLGRAPASAGIEAAAAYIVDQFIRGNVQPAGRQAFSDTFHLTTGVKLGNNNSVTFGVVIEKPGVPAEMIKPTKIGWKIGVDYQPWGFSESGTATGDVVFVGYGISSGSYDDYKDIDVKGKVVIVLRGLPKWAEKDETLKPLASLRNKSTLARDKGALAVAFVNERGDSSDVLARFGLDRLGKNSGIIALQVRRTACARVFPPKGSTLFSAELEIEKTKQPHSFTLANTTAIVTTSLEFIEGVTQNIVGIVRGTDPTLSGEYLVVGAHYDHLGMGDENSLSASTTPAIHYGADDNASGSAGVIELAQRFAQSPTRRSIVFMTFSGEEKGLLGSKHWVTNPTIPLSNIVAMINMDMIGRLKDGKLNIQGTGTSSVWPSVIDSAKIGLPLTVSTTADGFGPSDHSSFTGKGIPVLFYFTGLHSDYHRPTDTWDKINPDGEALVLTMVERSLRLIGDSPTRPDFTKGADKPAANQSSSIALKVSLGVVPDYSDDPQGLRITGVKAGSPAEKAGLAADDIVTKLGPTQIKNIYDLMSALGSFKPGETTDVTVLRDSKPVTMKVTFVGK